MSMLYEKLMNPLRQGTKSPRKTPKKRLMPWRMVAFLAGEDTR